MTPEEQAILEELSIQVHRDVMRAVGYALEPHLRDGPIPAVYEGLLLSAAYMYASCRSAHDTPTDLDSRFQALIDHFDAELEDVANEIFGPKLPPEGRN